MPITLGIIAVSKNVTIIFFPSTYSKINILIKILALSIFPIVFTGIGEHYLIATKKEKTFTTIIGIGMIINLILNLLLIKKYASIGVAIATIITEILIALIEIPIIKKMINKKETLKNLIEYLLYSSIMFIIVYLIGKINSTIIVLISQILTGTIIYITILALRKDKILINIISKIKE